MKHNPHVPAQKQDTNRVQHGLATDEVRDLAIERAESAGGEKVGTSYTRRRESMLLHTAKSTPIDIPADPRVVLTTLQL